MLIPAVPYEAERDNLDWARRAFAACGSLLVDVASSATPSPFRGRKVVAGPFSDLEAAGEFLNAGAAEIFVVSKDVDLKQFVDAYPPARIVVRTDSVDEIATIYDEGKLTSFQLVSAFKDAAKWPEWAKLLLARCPKCKLSFVVDSSEVTLDSDVEELETVIGALHKLVEDRPVHVVCKIEERSISEQPPSDTLSPARCLLRSLAPSDRPDGLIATVVTDERGIALGMVYSNEKSVITSIGCGRGVYWSRSRSSLWRKGDSSGAIQELISITPDCDQDALRFCVVQKGAPPAFCHTGARSCWGADGGVSHLFRTLQERKISAPAGSYTARLYGDMNLLRDKLLEEAAELSEAVKGCAEGKDSVVHVEEETADVLYFALTACVAGGGSFANVEHQLDKRSFAVKRRKGDAKQSRRDETESRLKELAASKKLKEGSS